MTQHTARRVRRKAGGTGAAILRGVLAAIAVTGAAVCVFAAIIALTDMGDQLIRIVNQLIKAGAAAFGACVASEQGDKAAVRRGAAVGAAYMGLGVLVYALLTSQRLTLWGYLADLLMGVAAGGLAGIARAQAKK